MRFARVVLLSLAGLSLPSSDVVAQDEFDEFEEPEVVREAPVEAPDEQTEETPIPEATEGPEHAEPSEANAAVPQGPYRGAEDPAWDRRFRSANTLLGSTGGVRVVDAQIGAVQSFRIQLAPEFFAAGSFLERGGSHTHMGASLSLSWAVHRFVEVYAGLYSHSDSNSQSDPALMLVLGDLTVGAKVPYAINAWLTVGGDLNFVLLTGTEPGLALEGTGFAFRANATADFRERANPLPFIARLNLQYVFDRSQRLIAQTERERYSRIGDARPIEFETRHLVDRFERFALGVNRTDFFNIGVGVEVPLMLGEKVMLSPLLEWTLGIPVNRQGYDCFFNPESPGSHTPAAGDDGCLDIQGFPSYPMDLTLGVRVHPPVRGFSALLAVDVGLTGAKKAQTVRELAANTPYNVMFGVSYAFDLRPVVKPPIIEREVERRVEIEPVLPPRGRVLGVVLDRQTGLPVPGVTVRLGDPSHTAQVTDEGGLFVSDHLEPAAHAFELTHPDYEPATCAAEIAQAGGDVNVRCDMARAVVVVQETEVEIREQILFAFDSAEILPASFGLMETIARVLSEHPELVRIEIQGHTDDQGAAAYNLQLSDRRAMAVRDWLRAHGVDAARLRSRGYGLARPLVPNTTDENRAKNRRVQFIIEARAVADAAAEPSSDAAEATQAPE